MFWRGFVVEEIFRYNRLMRENDAQKPKIAEAVSIVAHQLKNPISVLKGYLEILISEDFGKVNQKQKEYLDDALENVQRMAKVVSDLLDISRIEEGRYELKLEKFSLEKVTSAVIKDFSDWAKASNCQIFLKSEKDLLEVLADPFKIRQVIENLISNALRYRGPGQGKIEISLKNLGKEVLFSCQDNGIGIPPEDFPKVFSKFYRSEAALEADPSGTGLGLYINKAIIGLSGGKIRFEKNKDFGMTFYFTLPIAK